jgi:hypothetical protein
MRHLFTLPLFCICGSLILPCKFGAENTKDKKGGLLCWITLSGRTTAECISTWQMKIHLGFCNQCQFVHPTLHADVYDISPLSRHFSTGWYYENL